MMIVVGPGLFTQTDSFGVTATRMVDRFRSDMAVIPQAQDISKAAKSNPSYEEQAQRPRQICTYHIYHNLLLYALFVRLSITCTYSLVLRFSFERSIFVGRLIPKPADGKVRRQLGAQSSYRN